MSILYEEKDWDFWANSSQVKRAGGLIDPGCLDEFHRVACGYARHYWREALVVHQVDHYSDQFQNLSLFFIDNSTLNAVALHVGDKRGIGIHLGTVRWLWWLFYRAVASGKVLNHWFESPPISKDVSMETAIDDPIWRYAGAGRLPTDRAEVMLGLFLRALNFLVYHELAHHARGHIEFVKKELGLDVLDEGFNAAVFEGSEKALLRLIEFDADIEALDMLLAALGRESPAESWQSKQAGAEFFLHAAAILGVFQLLDLGNAPVANQYRQSHPAPVHRALRVTAALSQGIGDQVGWSKEQRIVEHDSAWYEASAMAKLLGMPEGRWHGGHTNLMDLERFKSEEKASIAFSKRLTDQNMSEMTPVERSRAKDDI